MNLFMSIGYVITFGLVFATLLSSYEPWVNLFWNPNYVWVAIPALFLCSYTPDSFVGSCTWYVSVSHGVRERLKATSEIMYYVYGTMEFTYQCHSFLQTTHGCSAYDFIVRMLGGKAKDQRPGFASVSEDSRAFLHCHC